MRNATGTSPLFYHHDPSAGTWFTFAFAVRALVESGHFIPRVNEAKVMEYIDVDRQAAADDHTFFRHVYRVHAGHLLRVDAGRITRAERYWRFRPEAFHGHSDTALIAALRTALIASVERATRGHSGVAASLSGGLDSSSICCIAQARRDTPLHTFNFAPGEAANEDAYIEAVVRQTGVVHRTITARHDELEVLQRIVATTAQPHFAMNHHIHLDLIEAARAADCTVFLSGHWGDQVISHGAQRLDELADQRDWAGLKLAIDQHLRHSVYIRPADDPQPDRSPSAAREEAARLVLGKVRATRAWASLPARLWTLRTVFGCTLRDFLRVGGRRLRRVVRPGGRPGPGAIFRPAVMAAAARLRADTPRQVLDPQHSMDGPRDAYQARHLASLFQTALIYAHEEYFAFYRAHGLEVAQPFCDAALMEICLAIPLRLKFGNGEKRASLRRAMAGILPALVAARVTKGEFSAFHIPNAIRSYQQFRARTPLDHPVWSYVDPAVLDDHERIAADDAVSNDAKKKPLLAIARVARLAVWLEYVEALGRRPTAARDAG